MVSSALEFATSEIQRLRSSDELELTDTVDALKSALSKEGMMIVHELNLQAMLQLDGQRIDPCYQVQFFRPEHVMQLRNAAAASLVEAPFKFTIRQDMGFSVVEWLDPLQRLKCYGSKKLTHLGAELATLFQKIAMKAVATETVQAGYRPHAIHLLH